MFLADKLQHVDRKFSLVCRKSIKEQIKIVCFHFNYLLIQVNMQNKFCITNLKL